MRGSFASVTILIITVYRLIIGGAENHIGGHIDLDEFKEYVAFDKFVAEHLQLTRVSGKIVEAVELFQRRQQGRMLRRKKAPERAEKESIFCKKGLYDEGAGTPLAEDRQLG